MLPRLKLKNCLSIILGSAILAFGLYNVHSISGVTEGGVLGLTLLLEHWFGISPSISGLVLNGACFVGVGVGLCIRANAAPTGDDSLALSLSHHFKIGIQWVYLLGDLIVLALSLTYIPFSKISYSLLTVVLSGQLIGLIQKAGKLKDTDTNRA